MPYWKIYAPEGTYNKEDKRALSKAITDIYVEFAELPRFYVVVLFRSYEDSFSLENYANNYMYVNR